MRLKHDPCRVRQTDPTRNRSEMIQKCLSCTLPERSLTPVVQEANTSISSRLFCTTSFNYASISLLLEMRHVAKGMRPATFSQARSEKRDPPQFFALAGGRIKRHPLQYSIQSRSPRLLRIRSTARRHWCSRGRHLQLCSSMGVSS